ncbi:MAG: ABC transporter ATP-binding protein [Gammaproteobacteria bacterium]|nr:ABC transporter ATP-binding protein [Gammaproteobacteria bacterium]
MSRLSITCSKQYREFALSVDLEFEGGKIVVLLGPSGSGKTTLLRLIAGLEKPDEGRIDFNDECWFDSQHKRYLPPRHRHIGMVFQDYALFEHLSVEKNIGFGVNRDRRREQTTNWSKRLHLENQLSSIPAQLSGGQRQRVALARALATEPALLLLDEPLSAIDFSLRRQLRREIKQVLREWNQTVILVTHDLDEARYFADELVLMHEGSVVQSGKQNTLFEQPINSVAAKMLGWTNCLEVERVQNDTLFGSWGSCRYKSGFKGESGRLYFKRSDLRLAHKDEVALTGKIIHVVTSIDECEVEIALSDGTVIEAVNREFVESCSVGDIVRIVPEGESILFFPNSME